MALLSHLAAVLVAEFGEHMSRTFLVAGFGCLVGFAAARPCASSTGYDSHLIALAAFKLADRLHFNKHYKAKEHNLSKQR